MTFTKCTYFIFPMGKRTNYGVRGIAILNKYNYNNLTIFNQLLLFETPMYICIFAESMHAYTLKKASKCIQCCSQLGIVTLICHTGSVGNLELNTILMAIFFGRCAVFGLVVLVIRVLHSEKHIW